MYFRMQLDLSSFQKEKSCTNKYDPWFNIKMKQMLNYFFCGCDKNWRKVGKVETAVYFQCRYLLTTGYKWNSVNLTFGIFQDWKVDCDVQQTRFIKSS